MKIIDDLFCSFFFFTLNLPNPVGSATLENCNNIVS